MRSATLVPIRGRGVINQGSTIWGLALKPYTQGFNVPRPGFLADAALVEAILGSMATFPLEPLVYSTIRTQVLFIRVY